MNNASYIPGKTRTEIATPAGPGGRHEQWKKIAISLVAQGFSPSAVFAQGRAMYAADFTDKDIADVIQWATKQNFPPCTPSFSGSRFQAKPLPAAKPVDPVANIRKFLGDFTTNECDLWHESPWRPMEDWRIDSLMFLAGMFHAGEQVNIVTDFSVNEYGKANPKGYGITLERDAMMRKIRDKGTPQSEAGAWLRMNPLDGKGVADANVTAYRFALTEFDAVPVELQLSVLARLPLPINAILLSGGKSVHAIIRLNATDADSYRSTVRKC